MSVSGLEQRFVPLVFVSKVWSPWGPGLKFPYPTNDSDAHGDDFLGELNTLQRRRRRSHSWGGYSTHAQLTSRGCVPDPDEHCDPETPLKKSVSDSIVDGRGEGNPRVRKLRLSEIIAAPLEPAPAPRAAIRNEREQRPVLLGSTQCQVSTSQREAKGIVEPQANPPSEFLEGSGAIRNCEKGAITTLAIRNLPYGLKLQELLQAMDDSGFAGLYDFVYLPHKFKQNRNLGFAFINFVSEDAASKFAAECHDSYRFTPWSLHKPLNISPAVVQGRRANQQKAASSFRPMCPHGSADTHGVLWVSGPREETKDYETASTHTANVSLWGALCV